MARTMPARIAHHQVLTKFEMLSSMRVGSGSLALNDLKKVTNFGMTNVARMTTTATAMTGDDRGVDQGPGDLSARVDVAIEVVRRAG